MYTIVYAILIGLLAVCSSGASAAEYGSREDAMTLVRRTQEVFKQVGADALIKAINSGDMRFKDRDLYVYIGDLDVPGLLLAHGAKPELVGKNLIETKDQNGKFFVRELNEVAKTRGSGWVDYRWQNPQKNKIEDKTTYVEQMGGGRYFVAVGVYKSEETNENTVGVISGNPNSAATYLQVAYDLSVVLNEGDNLRVVPVVGVGGVQNIRDVRTLKGIDIGLTQSNILNSYRRTNTEQVGNAEENKIVYLAKLFNEEIHLIVRSDITSISQLRGQKVNVDEVGSGSAFTMRDVFKSLGIEIEEINVGQADALEKMRRGEIAATAFVAGKPAPYILNVNRQEGFHLLPIPYAPALQEDYLPADLNGQDYPQLIEAGKSIETIAVSAVLIGYNWKPETDRYRRVKKFVEALNRRIDEFHKPPRHPKWREVNLLAVLPGWDRFEPAEALFGTQTAAVPKQAEFEQFLANKNILKTTGLADREKLFREFMKWRGTQ